MNTKPMTKEDLKGAEVVNQHTGEKWVYSSVVKDHFFHPRNLLLEDPKDGEFDAHGVVGSAACVMPETLVRTESHVLPINMVDTNTRVYAHDLSTQKISRAVRPKYRGYLNSIQTQLGAISATPDHLIYSICLPEKGDDYFWHTQEKRAWPREWNHASEIKRRDICIYPFSTKEVPLGELIIPQQRRPWDFSSIFLAKRVPIRPDLFELFGYFVAEGCTRTTEVFWTFGGTEMMLAKRVQKLVKKYFKLSTVIVVRKDRHRIDVVAHNTHLARWFNMLFGRGAGMKGLPFSMMLLPTRIQAGFLRGLWRGDGHVRLNYISQRAGYTTISPRLAHQLKILLLRQQIIPSCYTEVAKITKGVNHRTAYRIHVGETDSLRRLCKIIGVSFVRRQASHDAVHAWIEGNEVFVPVRKVRRQLFTGDRLWNIEVPKVHTYLTDAFAIHNCGDVMDIWLKVDRAEDKIIDLKWRCFGCGSAIASTSMFSVMLTENGGMKIDDALKVRPQDIMTRLAGLPNRKIHCSVLADKAFRKAVNEYFRASGQHHRVQVDGAKVVDKRLHITDKDIEEAVLEGAQTLEEVQQKLKVGVGDPEAIPEIEQLIRFYKEKYYG